ncbi:uncharacterized protein LOC131801711 isoform X3 [Musca domestica]|uniref:Uncharacterized protein LOC131801711 isoform X3 n=1 Tax=Musca domestica TaxID=7370 RepID=A0ABM3USV6_MUSDO|nr:uncharacterized protein LOC131801711 isoform X3 [Musca domestica]
MLPLRDDVLDRMGKMIGYTQVYLFTILLMYICYTFRMSACALPSDAQSNVCLGTVVLTLIMLALAITLAVGISLVAPIKIYPALAHNVHRNGCCHHHLFDHLWKHFSYHYGRTSVISGYSVLVSLTQAVPTISYRARH